MGTNPILDMLNRQTTIMPNNKPQYQQIPQKPDWKMVQDYVKQNGGDPKTAFFKLAKEKGIDPNFVLNMLRGR